MLEAHWSRCQEGRPLCAKEAFLGQPPEGQGLGSASRGSVPRIPHPHSFSLSGLHRDPAKHWEEEQATQVGVASKVSSVQSEFVLLFIDLSQYPDLDLQLPLLCAVLTPEWTSPCRGQVLRVVWVEFSGEAWRGPRASAGSAQLGSS